MALLAHAVKIRRVKIKRNEFRLIGLSGGARPISG